MKKIILLFALLAVAWTTANAYDLTLAGIYYNKNSDGTSVTVTEAKSSDPYTGSVSIPSTINYYGTIYSVTAIGVDAFWRCTGLTSITIGNAVTTIDKYAFYGCTGLTEVTIPNSVTSIGDDAFAYCYRLTSLTIGNSVTTIGKYAFYGCTELTEVHSLNETPPTCGSSVFAENVYTAAPLYVPKGKVSVYSGADIWRNFNSIVEEVDGIKGDANGDGVVNTSDVNVVIDVILGNAALAQYPAADVNGDGTVNVSDINAIINIILGL